MSQRTILVNLAEKDAPVHILIGTKSGSLLPYCLKASGCKLSNTASVPMSKVLQCPVCEDKRKSLAQFWAKQEELHPNE